MIIRYKKAKLPVILPLWFYEELKKTALKMSWTEEETLDWALIYGIEGVNNLDEMEKELSELIRRKKELDSELESIIYNYGMLSSRNAALRYEYFEVFSYNRTMSIKLTGAKAMNRSFKDALKIVADYNENEEITDRKIMEKYVFK